MDGLAIMAECFLCEPLRVAALLRPVRPSIAIAVQGHTYDTHKRISSEPGWPIPGFKRLVVICDKVAMAHQFIRFQTPKPLRRLGIRRMPRVGSLAAWS